MAIPTAKITINNETYLMTFGLDFLEQLNSKYQIHSNGFPISIGLQKALTELQMKNPVMIKDMILFATATNHSRPSEEEVEEYIFEQLSTEKKEDKLFDDFFGYSKKLPGATRLLKLAEEEVKKAEEKETKD